VTIGSCPSKRQTRAREEPQITAATRVLASYLARYCRGRHRVRSKRHIRADLIAAGCRVPVRDFDRVAGDAVRLRAYPIGSCDDGFFWMVDKEDFLLAQSYLVTRFKPITQRIAGVQAMMAERFGPCPAAPGGYLFDAGAGIPARDGDTLGEQQATGHRPEARLGTSHL
jgi:hypothetical protein